MQRLLSLILIFILGGASHALGDDHLLQTANQIYHLSEEMVFHGSEGHIHEIVDHGEKMIIEIDKLSRDIKKMRKPQLQKSLMATRKTTEEAIKLGRQGNLSAALASAKSASFHAKKVRQVLR